MAAIFAVFEVLDSAEAQCPETAEPVFVEGEPAAHAVLAAIESADADAYGYAVRVSLDGMTPLPRCDPDAATAHAVLWTPNAPRWVRVPLDPSKGYDAFGEALREGLEPVLATVPAFDAHVTLQFNRGGPVLHEFGVLGSTSYDSLGETARTELEERLDGPWMRWAPLTALVRVRSVRAC